MGANAARLERYLDRQPGLAINDRRRKRRVPDDSFFDLFHFSEMFTPPQESPRSFCLSAVQGDFEKLAKKIVAMERGITLDAVTKSLREQERSLAEQLAEAHMIRNWHIIEFWYWRNTQKERLDAFAEKFWGKKVSK